MTTPSARVLGLFAKWPRPGQVKTRLAAATSLAWAAAVAEAFLRDTLDRLTGVAARRVLVYARADAAASFADLARGRFELFSQGDGDLGPRMAAFFQKQFADGAAAVVLVGADSPTLPPAYVEQAFAKLEAADLVLGPATDGGYYLVGCAGRVPPIFEGIAWGSSTVLHDTVARLTGSAWRLAVLPPWYDVDTLDDWRMLQGHVAALRRAGVDPGVPHTEALLRNLLP